MTQQNLYKPPAAATPDFEPEASTPKSPRPISAWILLAFLVVMVVAAAFGVGRGAWMVATAWDHVRSPLRILAGVLGMSAVFAAVVAVIRGIYRGRPWARWIGLALIVSIAVFSIFGPDHTHYANDAEAAGGMLAKYILFPALFLWWAFAFTFTDKAKRYFSKPRTDVA